LARKYYIRKNFDKKWVGFILGDFFQKLIWSPLLVLAKTLSFEWGIYTI
jgi:hypothetical protein